MDSPTKNADERPTTAKPFVFTAGGASSHTVPNFSTVFSAASHGRPSTSSRTTAAAAATTTSSSATAASKDGYKRDISNPFTFSDPPTLAPIFSHQVWSSSSTQLSFISPPSHTPPPPPPPPPPKETPPQIPYFSHDSSSSSLLSPLSSSSAPPPQRPPPPLTTASAPPADHQFRHYSIDTESLASTCITAAGTASEHDPDRDDEDWVFEGGRRYHSNSSTRRGRQYMLPNDDAEQEREDIKHKLAGLLMRDGAMFYAPVKDRLRDGGVVYDLGTGTGAWVMSMAKEFPNTKIHACDISPIQPDFVWSNIYFSVDDFEEDWLDFEDDHFDLVHMRHSLFVTGDVPALLQKVLKHLKPGGYFEVQEFHYWPRSDDHTLAPNVSWAYRDFCYYFEQGCKVRGVDPSHVIRIGDLMREAGFEDVAEVRTKCPLGAWPRDKRQRERGLLMNMIASEGLPAIAKRPLGKSGLGWKDVQIEMFLMDVRRSMQGNMEGVHAYMPFHVVHGKKPEANVGEPLKEWNS